jgi:hypothetical protein
LQNFATKLLLMLLMLLLRLAVHCRLPLLWLNMLKIEQIRERGRQRC